ncbi:carbonic anhydrase [Thiocystis violacea]|uniref:carbonic anhydrase n=1 Tax=Thiocystis violacea TaxID=13725 RepID=UPI0019065E12|nr:carbonic anhydrase family protein [Thiocystis violacea]MBK1716836.1 carbonate dehydratase [Thiocystis violacea]
MNKPMILALLLATAGSALAVEHGAHWGYVGAEAPDHWGELDPSFSLCKNGKHQSPVDLTGFVDSQLPPIGFHYRPGGRDEVNNGHTIQIDYEAGSTITLDGRDYELKQFHFHTPSENHISGKEFPMEAHLVHADQDGHLAVIAVMIEAGTENGLLANPWSVIPEQADTGVHLPIKVSAEELLPKDRDYYRFDGSLTTPPCSEGVAWLVMKHPVTASHEQINRFARVMGHPNNRPIQNLNARVIVE